MRKLFKILKYTTCTMYSNDIGSANIMYNSFKTHLLYYCTEMF